MQLSNIKMKIFIFRIFEVFIMLLATEEEVRILWNMFCKIKSIIFRKGFSAQYALLTLIERWKFCLDKQGFAGTLLKFYF